MLSKETTQQDFINRYNHSLYRVCSVEIVAPYTLHLTFDDRSEQTINFQFMLVGQIYGPLRDLAVFNQVRVDPEVHTLVWPNGADFDPAALHDWPEQVAELSERTKKMAAGIGSRGTRSLCINFGSLASYKLWQPGESALL